MRGVMRRNATAKEEADPSGDGTKKCKGTGKKKKQIALAMTTRGAEAKATVK